MAKKSLQRISDERHARKLVFGYATGILGHKRSGLKLRPAIRLFAETQKLEIKGNLLDWIVGIYNSNDNKYICRGSYKEVGVSKSVGRKKKDIPSIKKKEKTSYVEFLKGAYWKVVRQLVLKRDGGKCTRCDSVKVLQAHHLTYKNHFR